MVSGSKEIEEKKKIERKLKGSLADSLRTGTRGTRVRRHLPKPLEWRSFYRHGLPLLMDFCEEVQKVSIQNDLNRSQTRNVSGQEQLWHKN
jgi:hypothetical protein